MIVGFTGTQIGMTLAQKQEFELLIRTLEPTEFHHGDCVGADEQAHQIVRRLFPSCKIIIHPPINKSKRANCLGDICHEPFNYMIRNTHIVEAAELMIGTPKGDEVTRSGTWSTIRKAKRRLLPVAVIEPPGKINLTGL